ncbi:MAG: lamin tail domain-containing protein [Planctomycetota bacterium]|nr:lamin tail domain-containing protein [Planctomycetota bacterium]MDA1105455.1 lamin tail domain-containing protein [Planctomycetota bacterium]
MATCTPQVLTPGIAHRLRARLTTLRVALGRALAAALMATVTGLATPPAVADVAWGREHEESAAWAAAGQATPGGANIAAGSDLAGVIFVNELMASNISTIADELGGFADWIELYNASAATVDIGGIFLTDDQLLPSQWAIPAGTTIAPGGHLLVWADNDPEQGPMHATFKLSSTGETVAVFDRDGSTLIDLVAFPALGDDVAFGRVDDGGAAVEVLADATPGSSNTPTPCPADINGDGVVDAADLGAVLGAWGSDGGSGADIDGDGTVAAGDLATLLGAWGGCQ